MCCMVKYAVGRTVGLDELGELDVSYAILSTDGSDELATEKLYCMCAGTALVWSVPMLSAELIL